MTDIFRKSVASLALVLLLVACGRPVPEDKLTYVGEWHGTAMYLLITQDGQVRYRRQRKSRTTSIDGPLKGFNGDNVVVGFGPITTTFIVEKAPYLEEGRWKMTVDGLELIKTAR